MYFGSRPVLLRGCPGWAGAMGCGDVGLVVVWLGLGVPGSLKNRFIVKIQFVDNYLGGRPQKTIERWGVEERGRKGEGDRERNPEMLSW